MQQIGSGDKRQASCNWSNADMQSANDQTLSQFVLVGNILMRKTNDQIGQESA